LIDTRGLLLPLALQRVAEATGLAVDALDPTGKKIDEVLSGIENVTPELRAAAAAAWYDPAVPELTPYPGARELLESLRPRVHLYLLTRGSPERQRNKVVRTGLGPLFERIVIRPIEQPGSKRDDILALLDGRPPERCAVIGDDPRDELKHARELGCLAIEVPATPLGEIEHILADAGLLAI
jgi:FMN phosphatase YigB (HAD superfamily)